MASRQGLFLVNRGGWRLLRDGRFFGVTCLGAHIYAFINLSPDPSRDSEHSGAIIESTWDGEKLVDENFLVDGLDHNCHQIAFHESFFFLVDTYHQSVLEYDVHWRLITEHRVSLPASRNGPDHAHINSIAFRGDSAFVMLHNGNRARPSEIVELDRQFRELNRITLPCSSCHDIVPLEDGRLLTCLSERGELGLTSGEAFKIDDFLTRGLAKGAKEIAVGSSLFGTRIERVLLPGFVTFLDHAFARVGRIYVPAAPTQIQLFDISSR